MRLFKSLNLQPPELYLKFLERRIFIYSHLMHFLNFLSIFLCIIKIHDFILFYNII